MSANLLAIFAPAEQRSHASSEHPTPISQEAESFSQPQKLPAGAAPKKPPSVTRAVTPVGVVNNKSTAVAHETIPSITKTPATQGVTDGESFSQFSSRWEAFLRPAQLAVCRAIWDMTYAIGEGKYFSSMTKLAAAAKLSERQCYRSVQQLERCGFIERPEIFNTATTKGTFFILHTSPIQAHLRTKRIYHVGE